MNIKTDEEVIAEFKRKFVEYHEDFKPYILEYKGEERGDEAQDIMDFVIATRASDFAAIRERIEGMSVAFQQYLDVCRKLEKEPYPQHRTGVEASIVLGRVKNIHDDLLSLLTVENKQKDGIR